MTAVRGKLVRSAAVLYVFLSVDFQVSNVVVIVVEIDIFNQFAGLDFFTIILRDLLVHYLNLSRLNFRLLSLHPYFFHWLHHRLIHRLIRWLIHWLLSFVHFYLLRLGFRIDLLFILGLSS